MSVIKASSLHDLKARVNLVDVVSRVVTVRRVGARFRGLCPFHQEKTPSFYVNPDNGFYKCFGCGKAGDAITFVRETEGLGFTEAVETLARRFGMILEYEEGSGPSREQRSLRQELFDLHEIVADHFHQGFKAPGGAGAFMREYWTGTRRFPLDLAEEFRIGAADAQGGGLAGVLLARKFSEEALRQCGLFFFPRENRLLTLGALRPRFRGRLMIPIRDPQGRVVAFTARQTELTPADDPAHDAKYVNSPETPIFTKGHLLFNLDRARQHVSDEQPFVMVEGQLDALRCWQVGVKTVIAPQGTSVTETQLVLLRRYQPRLECVLDGDTAGQKAAMRLLPMALRAGLEVSFLPLELGQDPDSLLRDRGLDAYGELQDKSLSSIDFLCRTLIPDLNDASPERKGRVAKEIRQIVSNADSQVIRAALINEAARALRLNVGAFNMDAKSWRNAEEHAAEKFGKPFGSELFGTDAPQNQPPELDLLLLCLHYEAFGKPLAHELLPRDWIERVHPAGRLLQRFLTEFEHDAWPGRDHLEELLETPEEKTLVASLLFDAPAIDDPRKVADEGLRRMQARALEPRLRQIELEIAAKQTDLNADLVSLLKSRTELQRQLRQPPALAVVV